MRVLNGAVVVFVASVLGVSLGAGCGGDSAGQVSTGLPPTQLLSDLSAEEAQQACERLKAGFQQRFNRNTVVGAACTLAAAAAESTPQACNETRELCVEEANMTDGESMEELDIGELDWECGTAEVDSTDCGDSTVAELEACFNDTLSQLSSLINRFSCADAATVEMDELEGFGDEVSEPAPSCAALECGMAQPFGG